MNSNHILLVYVVARLWSDLKHLFFLRLRHHRTPISHFSLSRSLGPFYCASLYHSSRGKPQTRHRRTWCCSFTVPPTSPDNPSMPRSKAHRSKSDTFSKPSFSVPNSPHSAKSGFGIAGRIVPRLILSPGRVSPIDSNSNLDSVQDIVADRSATVDSPQFISQGPRILGPGPRVSVRVSERRIRLILTWGWIWEERTVGVWSWSWTRGSEGKLGSFCGIDRGLWQGNFIEPFSRDKNV